MELLKRAGSPLASLAHKRVSKAPKDLGGPAEGQAALEMNGPERRRATGVVVVGAVPACLCVGPSPPALRGPRLDGDLGRGSARVAVVRCAWCVRTVCECVHVFADMNLAMIVPECTAECKRRVTRLTNGTNGADPMASCEASNLGV
jgi:hypothetical protein